jgi:hypothetical protein
MSHTTRAMFDGREVAVHHNSDFSGEARFEYDGREYRIPCELLMKLGALMVASKLRDDTISFLEDWQPEGFDVLPEDWEPEAP